MPEREVKLTPVPGFRLPALSDVVEGVIARPDEIFDLQAIYYDTADVRLARSGASLRYRDPEGWTVKLPAPGEGDLLVRGEHTFPGGPDVPPGAALDLVRAWARTAPVHAVARLKTRRRRIELTDTGGKKVAEVVDDEVSVLDGGRITSRFRELEVELGEDAPVALADALVVRLQAAGAGAPDPTPKIVRALGMRALAPPDVQLPGALSPGSPARHIVHAAIAASVMRLLAHDPGVRLGDDPEQVHQARVATRRLRSDLRTFRSLLVPEWDESLREELKWLGSELGAVRDTEVLLDLLRSKVALLSDADRHIGEHLLDRLVRQWEHERVELLNALRSTRYAQLLDRLVDAAREPALLPEADAPAIEVLPPLARKPWRRLRAAVEALPEVPEDQQLHAVRIAAKRSRYAAEAVTPALGKPARRFARAVADLQDVLGNHQDAVVAAGWLRDAAARAERPEEAFVAGMLTGMIRVVELETREAWPAAWKRARQRRLRAPA
ncbi:MAG: CYTH and CHAD domain-containing protein [Acidimicrobiia bacterium]